MNSYNKKKRNKNSHGIPTHALIASKPTFYQLPVLLTESPTYFIIYDHIEILHKITIRKTRLYKFIGVTHSQSLYNFFEFLRRAIVIKPSGLWRASKYVPPKELRTSVIRQRFLRSGGRAGRGRWGILKLPYDRHK